MAEHRISRDAPAKINLHLEILGQRSDGFHELETVFQALELADLVIVERRSGSGIRLSGCEHLDIPPERNLAWRAAAAYSAQRPGLGGLHLHIDKRIPAGGGLGGGSSDAAAVLLALAELDSEPLPKPILAELALGLGSDVPFFLVGGRAHGLGRGELLTALPDAPRLPVTLWLPPDGCPTPAVFRALSPAERGPRRPEGAAAWQAHRLGHNRLTEACQRACPWMAPLLAAAAASGQPWLLCGSGSTIAIFGPATAPAGVRVLHTTFRPAGR